MTGEFTLDTTGEVYVDEGPHRGQRFMWRNLSPFAQGYVEAMFASLDAWIERYADPAHGPTECPPGFSDLAPSTLAAILKDCADYRRLFQLVPHTEERGRMFWQYRQARDRNYADYFPPPTVSLNDAGQVVIGGDRGSSVASRGGSPASPVKSDSAGGH